MPKPRTKKVGRMELSVITDDDDKICAQVNPEYNQDRVLIQMSSTNKIRNFAKWLVEFCDWKDSLKKD